MLQSLPNPQPDIEPRSTRNPWAIVDLIVFALFFVALFVLITPFARLPIIYAIPLQGLFNITLVGFIAGWVRIVKRTPFSEYIHFKRSRTFSTQSLIILGTTSAVSVLILSALAERIGLLPPSGQTPLEKLLTTRGAIMMFAVFGVAVAPMLEEIIFRGFVFKVLWEIGGSGVAILVTAALFALLHAGQLAGNWGSVVLIFLVGCILSIVRHRSNSIIPTFIVHTSYNSVLFLLFAFSSLVQKTTK
jgi:membrane protease YdiL (CAAX protease family)